jgi:uncharacterized protein DUF4019
MKTCARLMMLLVCSFALAQTPASNQPDPARDASKRDAAKQSADSWLALLDAHDYFDNWDRANLTFKSGINKVSWQTIWKGVRDPLGDFQGRTFKRLDSKFHLPEDPKEDKWIVLEYDSVFTRRSAIEIVALKQDRDGQWRVAGYNVVPTGPGRTLVPQPPTEQAAATTPPQPPQPQN